MTQHAKLSASGSHRWLHCPGSIKAESKYKDTTSNAALWGTACHEIAEQLLTSGEEPVIGSELHGVEITEEMVNTAQDYVDYVNAIDGESFYEQRVDFSDWVPDGYGTADCIKIGDNTLHVIDLKTGTGVVVDAEENTQGLLYAMGAYSDFGFMFNITKVVIHIYQGRIGNIQTWELGLDDLLNRANWIKERAELALSADAPRIPSDSACNWCKARADCPALYQHTQEVILIDFDNISEKTDLPDPGGLTDEQVGNILRSKSLIEGFLRAVQAKSIERLGNGEKVPGFHLGEGRGTRKWVNDEDVATMLDFLGHEAYEKKILSPNKVKQLIGIQEFRKLESNIVKIPGKPCIKEGEPCEIGDSNDFEALE